MESQIKKEPAYKEAVERILERFESEGYGAHISDEEFDRYLSIVQPTDKMEYREFQKLELERLQRYQAIEELLVEHSICLIRAKKIAGFQIVAPREQITIGFERRWDKVKLQIRKTGEILLCLDNDKLTQDEKNDLQRKMAKVGFLKAAVKKRKFEISDKGGLKIANG